MEYEHRRDEPQYEVENEESGVVLVISRGGRNIDYLPGQRAEEDGPGRAKELLQPVIPSVFLDENGSAACENVFALCKNKAAPIISDFIP